MKRQTKLRPSQGGPMHGPVGPKLMWCENYDPVIRGDLPLKHRPYCACGPMSYSIWEGDPVDVDPRRGFYCSVCDITVNVGRWMHDRETQVAWLRSARADAKQLAWARRAKKRRERGRRAQQKKRDRAKAAKRKACRDSKGIAIQGGFGHGKSAASKGVMHTAVQADQAPYAYFNACNDPFMAYGDIRAQEQQTFARVSQQLGVLPGALVTHAKGLRADRNPSARLLEFFFFITEHDLQGAQRRLKEHVQNQHAMVVHGRRKLSALKEAFEKPVKSRFLID